VSLQKTIFSKENLPIGDPCKGEDRGVVALMKKDITHNVDVFFALYLFMACTK
jgi:hypothetical protein